MTNAWAEELRGVTRELHPMAEGVPSEVALNVLFHVPGPLWWPTYSGMRTGHHDKDDRTMVVQVAIPPDHVGSMRAYVVDSLSAAVDLAERWCVKRGHCSSLETARELAKRLARPN